MKKYLFGIFAIALAIGFSAFTTAKQKATNEDLMWFLHDSGPIDEPGSYIVDSYQGNLLGCNEETSETTVACRILAPFTEPVPEEFVADFSGITVFDEKYGNGTSQVSVRLKE